MREMASLIVHFFRRYTMQHPSFVFLASCAREQVCSCIFFLRSCVGAWLHSFMLFLLDFFVCFCFFRWVMHTLLRRCSYMRKGLSLAYQGLNTMVRSSSVFFSLLLCDMFIFSEFAVACSCLALCVFLRGACDGRLGVSALWMRVDLFFFHFIRNCLFFSWNRTS